MRFAVTYLIATLMFSSVVSAQAAPAKTGCEGSSLVDAQWALEFAQEWIDAWNSHDLERILSHYTEDFEMASPLIVERMGEPSGVLKGKAAMRGYWGPAIKGATPPVRFELLGVFTGVRSITLHYRSVGRGEVAEVVSLNARGEVIRGSAHYMVEPK